MNDQNSEIIAQSFPKTEEKSTDKIMVLGSPEFFKSKCSSKSILNASTKERLKSKQNSWHNWNNNNPTDSQLDELIKRTVEFEINWLENLSKSDFYNEYSLEWLKKPVDNSFIPHDFFILNKDRVVNSDSAHYVKTRCSDSAFKQAVTIVKGDDLTESYKSLTDDLYDAEILWMRK